MQRMATAMCAVALLVVTGCATKGQLRNAMAEQTAALNAERSERIASDERLAADLATLRNDLTALRNEFNVEIEAVAAGLQFIMPVHFGYDEATVRSQDIAALERFADVVNKHYTGALVTVEGFADPAGSTRYNAALSERRAEAVRAHLMQHGIQAQLRTVGYGEDRLVVPGAEKDDPGAELNRRVVFVVESPRAPQVMTMIDG